MTDSEDPSGPTIDPVVSDDPTDTDDPPDPNLDPRESPGVDADVEGLEDIELSRDDVELGEAAMADLTVGDTAPVAGDGLESLVSDLADGTPRDRRRAAIALSRRDLDEAAVAALASSVRSDPDAEVRQFAVEALGEHGSDRAGQVAQAALDDDDPWVRAESVVTLDSIDRDRYAESVDGTLEDDHPAVRRNALVSVWKRRGADALDTILEFVDDESDRVREWVATMLADVEDERAERALRTLAEDRCDVVATAARRALEKGSTGPSTVGGGSGRSGGGPPTGESGPGRPPEL
ncbi:MAG: hypothetical protein ACI9PP_001004 [Halobacteriales archaeon]